MSDDSKCDFCHVHQKQDGKQLCIKCEGLGFVAGDNGNNSKVVDSLIAKLEYELKQLNDDSKP